MSYTSKDIMVHLDPSAIREPEDPDRVIHAQCGGCTSCTGCTICSPCSNCTFCSSCTGCSGCSWCSGCSNVTNGCTMLSLFSDYHGPGGGGGGGPFYPDVPYYPDSDVGDQRYEAIRADLQQVMSLIPEGMDVERASVEELVADAMNRLERGDAELRA